MTYASTLLSTTTKPVTYARPSPCAAVLLVYCVPGTPSPNLPTYDKSDLAYGSSTARTPWPQIMVLHRIPARGIQLWNDFLFYPPKKQKGKVPPWCLNFFIYTYRMHRRLNWGKDRIRDFLIRLAKNHRMHWSYGALFHRVTPAWVTCLVIAFFSPPQLYPVVCVLNFTRTLERNLSQHIHAVDSIALD
jgi:hypothetical protein